MRKLIFNDSFDFPEAEHLVHIVDDPDQMKTAAAKVRDQWGDVECPKNHSLVHIIALSSLEKTGYNLNGDGFEEEICRRSHPDFVKRANLYRHHRSKVPKDQRDGDVLRSAYNDDMGRVELLIAANHDKCADWLGNLEKGGSVKFSMGWHCQFDECSLCGNHAKKASDYCDHLKRGAKPPYGKNRTLPDGRKCGMINREGHWNDISYVDTGADMIAMDLAKIAGLEEGEAIGSADLAELMEGRILSTHKLAIAQKLAEIQKQIQAIGVSPKMQKEQLSESTLKELQSKPAKDLFGAVKQANALLSFQEFMRVVSGSQSDLFQDAVKVATDGFRYYLAKELSSLETLEQISSIHDYDPKDSKVSISKRAEDELSKRFSLQGSLQSEKIAELSLFGENLKTSETQKDKTARALVRQYLAYKVAALAAMPVNEEVLFDSVILN